METVWRTKDFGYFAYRGVIYCIFEWIHIAEHLYPTQFATVFFACGVFGHLTSHIGKRFRLAYCHPFATFLHFLLHASGYALAGKIDFRQCLCFCHRVCIRRTLDSDMCSTAHVGLTVVTHLYKTINGLVILHVFWSGLRTIACQLFLKGFGGVHALGDGFSYFQFEVDKEVQILFHRFLFKTCFLIVFLIDVHELRQHHGFAVDGHQYFVFLREAHHGSRQQDD